MKTIITDNTINFILTKIENIYERIFHPFEIAVDLGTLTTRLGIVGKGVILKEPTFIGKHRETGEYIFFGKEAYNMIGKTPPFIEIISPIDKSILSDFDACTALLLTFIQKSIGSYYNKVNFIKPSITSFVQIPSNATEVEQKATKEVFRKIGCRNVYLCEKAFCAAAGAGYNIFESKPIFIIDFGAGSVEIAVIIMTGLVSQKTLPFGGNYMNKLIANYIHLKHGLITGDLTIEQAKTSLFNLSSNSKTQIIRGKSLENGLPKSIKITTNDIKEALSQAINSIIDGIKEVMETIPPEIIDSILKNGIVLTGEIAKCEGLAKFISSDIKIPITVPEKASEATINGLLKLAQDKKNRNRIFF